MAFDYKVEVVCDVNPKMIAIAESFSNQVFIFQTKNKISLKDSLMMTGKWAPYEYLCNTSVVAFSKTKLSLF